MRGQGPQCAAGGRGATRGQRGPLQATNLAPCKGPHLREESRHVALLAHHTQHRLELCELALGAARGRAQPSKLQGRRDRADA